MTHKVLKNIFLLWIGLLSANYCHAQWTKQDSLKLAELLKKEGEIELNPEALQSIDFLKGSIGVETNGTATNGNSGFASPYSDPQHYRRHFDFDETLPFSPFPRVATDTLAKGMHMSLLPYHGIYLYNLNPVSGKRVPMGGMMDRKTYEISRGQIVPGQGGPMNDMRLMMMGGSMGGSFKTDFDQMFSLQYWNFRQRRAANKTLVALAAYNNSEQQCGRYEYFHVDNEEYSLNLWAVTPFVRVWKPTCKIVVRSQRGYCISAIPRCVVEHLLTSFLMDAMYEVHLRPTVHVTCSAMVTGRKYSSPLLEWEAGCLQ